MMKSMETERLLLRPFTMDDVEDVHREIYSDEAVVHWYSGAGVLTVEQTRERVAGHLLAWREELGRHAVILKGSHEFCGQVHLSPFVNRWYRRQDEPEPRFNGLEVELAFAFGKRFWGKSYAYEACQAMIRYAFVDLRLPRLVGGAHGDNIRSANLQRRLGYSIEKSADGSYVTVLDNSMV
jgi:ribosomal-protein-alanine N-acetyltransferase